MYKKELEFTISDLHGRAFESILSEAESHAEHLMEDFGEVSEPTLNLDHVTTELHGWAYRERCKIRNYIFTLTFSHYMDSMSDEADSDNEDE